MAGRHLIQPSESLMTVPDTPGFLLKVTKGGMAYQLWPGKSGKKASQGKFVKVNLLQTVNDSVLFTTRNSIPSYFRIEEPKTPYDISEVIPTLKEGDSIIVTQLFDTLFVRDPQSAKLVGFKKGDVFITTLTVIKVFDRENDYLNDEEKEMKRKKCRNLNCSANTSKQTK